MQDGTLTQTKDGYALRFERELHHPAAKVWAALTQPERMKGWLSDNAEVDLRVGGVVRFHDHQNWGHITDLQDGSVIAFEWRGDDWDGGIVRWEITPSDGGTHLVLTHEMPPMSDAEAEQFMKDHPGLPDGWHPVSSTLAGWHEIVDRLGRALDGEANEDFDVRHSRWAELNEHYKQLV
jgi:uncharacterized protein YndB with AHSA1/START domain